MSDNSSIILTIKNTPDTNKQISKLGSKVTSYFDSSLLLDDGEYILRMINFSCVYCMPNVTTINNTLTYTYLGVTHNILFDTVLYSLDDINTVIRMYTAIANNNGNLFQFSPDEATSKL